MKNFKKILMIFLICLLIFLIALWGALFYLKIQSSPRDSIGEEHTICLKIEPGMTARDIANELYAEKIIKSAEVFYVFARFPFLSKLIFVKSDFKTTNYIIKPGICDLSSTMDVETIYQIISVGRSEKISFPEGMTISKIAARLEQAGICDAEDFIAAAHDKAFLATLNLPFESAEGYLFPDTYYFALGSSGKICVKAMVENFFRKIRNIENFNSITIDYRNRLVIIASVIEREYRAVDEAPMIASVFMNRVQNKIGLFSCATVEYVITEILGRPHPDVITLEDLKIENPYNTYINEYLPPTPISNPGLVALNAAANPAKSKYFFFRLMDEDEGRHVFTKTIKEHIAQDMIYKTKKSREK